MSVEGSTCNKDPNKLSVCLLLFLSLSVGRVHIFHFRLNFNANCFCQITLMTLFI